MQLISDKNTIREYPQGSIVTTWTVSYNFIKEKNVTAAGMLQLWACLNNNDIWYGLFKNLQRWSCAPDWFANTTCNQINFRKIVRTLLAFSLIEMEQE